MEAVNSEQNIARLPDAEPDPQELARYNRCIGERIRAIRSRQGLIRKHLSNHSGVSERYLAQAETGQANISIALLWRIAHALEVRLVDLLPDGDTASVNAPLLALLGRLNHEQQEAAFDLLNSRFGKLFDQVHGVALIGLRGAGKSRLGRLLADEYKIPFVRLGDKIEQLAQLDIGELLSLGGQKAYRRLEKQALERVLEQYPAAVLEAGGSLVTQPDTYSLLLESYFTVWLKASPEEHMNRVSVQGERRAMQVNKQTLDDIKFILAEREADYRLANYILDTSGRNVSDCAVELARHCKSYLRARRAVPVAAG